MKNYRYKEYFSHIFPCLGYGILCGTLTGAFIFFFKLAASYLERLSRYLYACAKTSPIGVCLCFASLALLATVMALVHKKIPEVRGGGIPRSEGILRGTLRFRWLKTLLGTIFCSFLSFLGGLPLGSEGPAVLIGTSIGHMSGNITGKHSPWNRYIMTGGAGAGFAVATGAPLSGILFALEEIHKRFTPMLVIAVSTSVLSATYVNRLLCSLFGISENLFDIGSIGEFKLSHVGYLLLLGAVIAILVSVFNTLVILFDRLSDRLKKKLPQVVFLLFVFFVTGLFALYFADGVYSGHHLIIEVATHGGTLGFLALLLIVRVGVTLPATESGATGGIFIPTLAIGACAGGIAAKLLIAMGMPSELFSSALLLGMCAFIGGTLRAPLTATVLFIEITSSFTNLFFVAIVIFTVNFVTELLDQQPFYETVLEDMEEAQNEGMKARIVCFEMKVEHGAFVVGKSVRDIMWPPSSVVISIVRENNSEEDMDHDGEKKLLPGDTVIMRSKLFDEKEVIKQLSALVGDNIRVVEE